MSFAFDLFGAPSTVSAIATKTATGVDRQTAILFGYADGEQAVLHTALDTRGPNTAAILGTNGRIEIDPVWYTPTEFTVFDADGQRSRALHLRGDRPRHVSSRPRSWSGWCAEGRSAGDILPPQESVRIMDTLDEIRRQIGLRYPGSEDASRHPGDVIL